MMEFEVEDDKIVSVTVTGGCDGNLKGISRLIRGMSVQEVVDRLEGIRCGGKPTSCPDQIARALKAYQAKQAEQAEHAEHA
jgi:uncharacterized protein (TIGR03905 family)